MRTFIMCALLTGVASMGCAAEEPKPVAVPAPTRPETPAPEAPAASPEPVAAEKPAVPAPGAVGSVRKAGGAPIDPKIYVVGAEDVLMIQVWREPELSRQITVRPDGRISMPLINEVTAAGLTPEQLQASLVQALSKFMRTPDVTVTIMQVNSKKYFIQGEINKPGPYPLVVPTTILEGLVNAGGFRDFANRKKIVILRGNKQLFFNYNQVTHGKHAEQNILLEPGDQIIVH